MTKLLDIFSNIAKRHCLSIIDMLLSITNKPMTYCYVVNILAHFVIFEINFFS